MSLGILSRGRRPPLGAAYVSVIPPECWSQTGFNDCHAKAYAQAQTECQSQGLKDDLDCINPAADAITMQNCACKRATATPPKPAVVKPKVVSSSSSPDSLVVDEEPTFLGLPMKTVAMVGLVGVGLYLFTQPKGKK